MLGYSLLAHRVISRRRSKSVAFGAKRTLTNRQSASIYEDTPYLTRDPEKPILDLIGDGNRLSDKIMRRQ